MALAVAGVLIFGGAAAFGVAQLTGDDATEDRPAVRSGAGGDGQAGAGRRVVPSEVTVAVLNGTLVPGLAAQLSDEVKRLGFETGTVGNDSDQEQQRAESVVLYAAGHEREAVAVSRRMNILQREKVDPATQALAGDASVIIIAGADKTP